MPEFMSFFRGILLAISEFLLVEPICWFTGLVVLVFIARLVDWIIHPIRGR